MTLNQLRYFQAVCQYQSITKAAEKLMVSQPSVSVAVKELEEELQVSLLTRKNNKILVTKSGEIFFRMLTEMFDTLDTTISFLRQQENNQLPRIIRLGVPPVTGACAFPRLLAVMQEVDSSVRIDVTEESYVKLQKMVLNEMLDYTLCLEDGERFEELVYLPVMKLELCFCVNRKNPLAKQHSVEFSEIQFMDIASLGPDSYNFNKVKRLYQGYHSVPKSVFRSNRPHAVVEYIRSNPNAGAFLPRGLLENDSSLTALSLRPARYMDIVIAARKETMSDPTIISFWDRVLEKL